MKSKKLTKDRGDKNYMSKDEKHDRKQNKKEMKSMKTAGIATAFKKAKMTSKLVKPKQQRKV